MQLLDAFVNGEGLHGPVHQTWAKTIGHASFQNMHFYEEVVVQRSIKHETHINSITCKSTNDLLQVVGYIVGQLEAT